MFTTEDASVSDVGISGSLAVDEEPFFRRESDRDANEKINHLLVFEGLKAESRQDAKV